jgi:diaminohydroxyphosphoribosylaminopyrimidine deaminase/5-amino-6-(5-phosphoribosylamino)uracil reductase
MSTLRGSSPGKLNSFTFAACMTDELYMKRCLELASKGAGQVAPNPMVGAVLVYEDRIIGEGWHMKYGNAHAEANCIASVKEADSIFIPKSTLYVSLEPCAHHGKTPPCADLIIKHKIPVVVIGCRDPFPLVNGKGIEKLISADVLVKQDVLKDECIELNRRFFTFHEKKRPYIILKWAQTADHFIAATNDERLLISNESSNSLVHRWRSEEAAVMIGTNTAMLDDPLLTNRLWPGSSPTRIVIDLDLKLPSSLRVFNDQAPTIVVNHLRDEVDRNITYIKFDSPKPFLTLLCTVLHEMNIQSIIVEGGAKLLQSFIDEDLWDEARVITNTQMKISMGLSAPILPNKKLQQSIKLASDTIDTWRREP